MQAALRDAEKRAAALHVPTHIRLQAPSAWPWSAATLAAGVLLVLFMPAMNLLAKPADEKRPQLTTAQATAQK